VSGRRPLGLVVLGAVLLGLIAASAGRGLSRPTWWSISERISVT
jgi:hypothetical protein